MVCWRSRVPIERLLAESERAAWKTGLSYKQKNNILIIIKILFFTSNR
jgi:hypothetical protein